MSHTRRLIPAVLALALLSAAPVLPQARRGAPPPSTSFSEALGDFLPGFFSRLWSALGCEIDPFGSCRPAHLDLGCSADPLGCRPVPPEAGCDVDPFGRCKPASSPSTSSPGGDLGCDIDPYGRCSSFLSPTGRAHH